MPRITINKIKAATKVYPFKIQKLANRDYVLLGRSGKPFFRGTLEDCAYHLRIRGVQIK